MSTSAPEGFDPQWGPGWYGLVLVVDPDAVRKLDAGVYSAASVGIRRPIIVKDPDAPGGRIVDGRIPECSLCDRGANKAARLRILKAAGADEVRALGKEPAEAQQIELNEPAETDEPATCPVCDREVPADGLFCPYCGAAVHDEPDEDDTVKAVAPDLTRLGVVDLVKALSTADAGALATLTKALGIDRLADAIEDSTKAATAAIEKRADETKAALDDLTKRLATVEGMAVPGGPARSRPPGRAAPPPPTPEVERLRALEDSVQDPTLREGYRIARKAIEAEPGADVSVPWWERA